MTRIYPIEKANEIQLDRQVNEVAFLLVEGSDDRNFMQRFICSNKCRVEVIQGKKHVCNVIKVLDERGVNGVIGMVDADLHRIEVRQDRPQNIVMPEYHDLETMLLCSPALDRLLGELGSQKKLAKISKDVLETLLEKALPLGLLRLYSYRSGLDLKFDGLNYSAWVDRKSFQISIIKLINVVKNHSQQHNLSSAMLEHAIRELNDEHLDPREVCNGNDLIEILSIGLRRKLGNQTDQTVAPDVLRRYLRLAYTEQDFQKSSLGDTIRGWEAQATGFQILRR